MKTLVQSVLLLSILVTVSCDEQSKSIHNKQKEGNDVFISPLGKKLALPEASQKMLEQHEKARKDLEQDPEKLENYIWYGRRTAYLGKFQDAIQIYTRGIEKFPKDARLYRHRGHRYISIRQFDKAIQDLETAVQLIQGSENTIEPDGMPNAQNIPISTLHGNIWYHLGLAYYLKHDYEKAYAAYLKCRESGANDDNIVSSTHWLYMIQRRLGDKVLATQLLEPIRPNATIIENYSYYSLCKFYKGINPVDSLEVFSLENPATDAVKYGLANWYFYNNQKDKAREQMEALVSGKSWSSFGYIAAEGDLIKYFDQ